jgi:T-complex protein 1 subunit beta
MDTDKIKIFGARMKVDSTGKLAELERAERVCICHPAGTFISLTPSKQEKMKAKVEAIASHGINVFVNRQLVYNYPENLLAEKGIMSIEHADFEGVERLSLVTGGEITSTFDRPDLVKLGRCDLIEEIMIGEDKVSLSSVTQYRLLTDYYPAHQILRRCSGRGVYSRIARFNSSNGRRGRTFIT